MGLLLRLPRWSNFIVIVTAAAAVCGDFGHCLRSCQKGMEEQFGVHITEDGEMIMELDYFKLTLYGLDVYKVIS